MDYRPVSEQDFQRASKWVPALPLAIFWMGAYLTDDPGERIPCIILGVVFSIAVMGLLRLGALLHR